MKRVLIILGVIGAAGMLLADGGVFPPPGNSIKEPEQHAILEYDGSTEVLHLLVNVSDVSSSFGWIVPLPSQPGIEEDTPDVFSEIEEMCRPVYYDGFGCGSTSNGYGLGEWDYHRYYGIDVLEEGSLGVLHYRTITAPTADSLFGWLTQEGYAARDSLTAESVFTDYIARGWVFVVFRVDSSQTSSVNIQPVKFTFSSSEMVYPMRITSLSYDEDDSYEELHVLLHVITDHRVEAEDQDAVSAAYEFANRLSAKEYEAVEKHYPSVAKICTEGDFITRIWFIFRNPSGITSDIVLEPANNDTETFNAYSMLLFPLLPLAFALGFRLRRFLRKARRR